MRKNPDYMLTFIDPKKFSSKLSAILERRCFATLVLYKIGHSVGLVLQTEL